jgi:hypothetical protein
MPGSGVCPRISREDLKALRAAFDLLEVALEPMLALVASEFDASRLVIDLH